MILEGSALAVRAQIPSCLDLVAVIESPLDAKRRILATPLQHQLVAAARRLDVEPQVVRRLDGGTGDLAYLGLGRR
ncbi:hypothetical protein D3C80_1227680 [compost metagenome]